MASVIIHLFESTDGPTNFAFFNYFGALECTLQRLLNEHITCVTQSQIAIKN